MTGGVAGASGEQRNQAPALPNLAFGTRPGDHPEFTVVGV